MRKQPVADAMDTEAREIRDALDSALPEVWDGKRCILKLHEADHQWRQMEWIGWFFEYEAKRILLESLGGEDGPRFGNTAMDYKRHFVWDLKAHVTNSGQKWAVLNDQEAIRSCIEEFGAVGFVIVCGEAEYDDTGAFKQWHDALKGKPSAYEEERIRRGAPSRRRKTAFNLKGYRLLVFRSSEELAEATEAGWLGDFQKGMRNADGSARRGKYKVRMDRIPSEYLAC